MDSYSRISYFTFQDKVAFFPLKFVYPECFVHIKDSPKLYPLKCFMTDSCPPGANCGEILVKRVHYLFQNVVPQTKMLIAYYKYPDRPQSIRGAIFYPDLDVPQLSILNPHAFQKFRDEGQMYEWVPPHEYLFMGGSQGLIPVENLIR